jgi:hypothetical protein
MNDFDPTSLLDLPSSMVVEARPLCFLTNRASARTHTPNESENKWFREGNRPSHPSKFLPCRCGNPGMATTPSGNFCVIMNRRVVPETVTEDAACKSPVPTVAA